ncbi:MAG TPA: hypothetical protein VMU34_16590 [Mycobacterium sp.]|nr:hypothetical protein [Mycobacterium sp.]
MNLKKIVAQAGIASFAALGVGAGVAHADPGPWPPPAVPGAPGVPGALGAPLPPGQDFRPQPGPNHDWRSYPADDWHGRWVNPPWGTGAPPWGWGRPPRPGWDGPLPPPGGPPPLPVNYWGYAEQPVWDPGYNQWGFWLAGVWIPR